MKYSIIVLAILFAPLSFSQSMKDFFSNKTQVVLLGLDFSQAKFIGKDGFASPDGLKNHAIKGWNRFFATEPGKYSLQEALGLSDKYYYNSINYFIKQNDELVDQYKCITDEPYTLTEDQIVSTISAYAPFEKQGLAISFLVESFDKTNSEANIWVVFLSLPSNEIIYKQKMKGTPGGAGQLNFWARAVYDIVSQIEKTADDLKSK